MSCKRTNKNGCSKEINDVRISSTVVTNFIFRFIFLELLNNRTTRAIIKFAHCNFVTRHDD